MNIFLLFLISILILIVAISFLIIIHELGHFTIAKIKKVHIFEFVIGAGPVIFQTKKTVTKFKLKLFPLGGYVSFLTDEQKKVISEVQDGITDKESFQKAQQKYPFFDLSYDYTDAVTYDRMNIRWKSLFIFAGVMVNILFALIVYMSVNFTFGRVHQIDSNPIVAQIASNNSDIIKIGDSIKKGWYFSDENNTQKVETESNVSLSQFETFLNKKNSTPATAAKPIFLNVKRHGPKFFYDAEKKAELISGVEVKNNFNSRNYLFINFYGLKKQPPAKAFGYGLLDTLTGFFSVPISFVNLFIPDSFFNNDFRNIASISSSVINWSPYHFLITFALLSSSLALLNAIPIPPLDGYKFVEELKAKYGRKSNKWSDLTVRRWALWGNLIVFIMVFAIIFTPF